jgi:hypothetical protein
LTKKIVIGILALIIGIGIAFYSESFFRKLVQNIFQWSTAEKIKFIGKNFFVFSNKLYFISFGITLSIFSLANLNQNITQILKSGILSALIFIILIVGISAIDANLKLIECTACENGIRKLHWNDINYGLILGISSISSIIPSGIKIFKKWKKASVQQRV